MAKAKKKISEQATEYVQASVSDANGISVLAQLAPGDMLAPYKTAVRAAPAGTVTQLGTVGIEVRALSYRHNPQDETTPSIALVGPCKFIPADPQYPELRAMRCFLPGAVHDAIVAGLEGDSKRPVEKSPGRKDKPITVALGQVVPVVLEVAVQSNESAVGYKYLTQANKKVPLKLEDPLARLFSQAGIKSLPAPGAGKTIELSRNKD